jgi:hypothetical protein
VIGSGLVPRAAPAQFDTVKPEQPVHITAHSGRPINQRKCIMSKFITPVLVATFLLTGGFQTAANAQTGDRATQSYSSDSDRSTTSDSSGSDREYVCKVLQRNCS